MGLPCYRRPVSPSGALCVRSSLFLPCTLVISVFMRGRDGLCIVRLYLRSKGKVRFSCFVVFAVLLLFHVAPEYPPFSVRFNCLYHPSYFFLDAFQSLYPVLRPVHLYLRSGDVFLPVSFPGFRPPDSHLRQVTRRSPKVDES